MSFSQLAFSFDGRMRRRDFWIGHVLLAFVIGFTAMILLPAAAQLGFPWSVRQVPVAFGAIVQVLTLWPALAIAVKRGHDRNRPAAWIFAVYAIDVTVSWGRAFNESLPPWGAAVEIAILAYVVVDLGLVDGTKGANRFGPSPKTPASAAPAAPLAAE